MATSEVPVNEYDLCRPVSRLVGEGLHISQLINTQETEFEIRPDEEETNSGEYDAESCFDYENVEKLINMEVLDFDDEEEDDGNSSPFDKYRRRMTDLRPDGKIKKHVVKQGCGQLLPDNCLAYIRYQAYLEYQEVPFDCSNYQSYNQSDLPIGYDLGKGELLPGLHEAVLSMKKGEKAEFLIHHDLAFGKMGCPPRVPKEATVLFIVEVDRFVDCGEIHNNNDDLSWEERNKFCNISKVAKSHYLLACDIFNKGNYNAAANKYRQVINMLHNARLADEEEELKRNHFLIKLYTNACVCYHKLKNFKRVCVMASDAMQVNEREAQQNAKLLYFWGYAKMCLNDYEGSKKHLRAALKIKPRDSDIQNAIRELDKRKKDALVQEKVLARKVFGFQPANTCGVKITEISEEEERQRTMIKEQLKVFVDDHSRQKITMIDSFTLEEEKMTLEVAKELGLYGRVIAGSRRIVEITKPEED